MQFSLYIVLIGAIINLLLPGVYYSIFPYTKSIRFGIPVITSFFNHPGKYGWFLLFMAIFYYSKYKYNHISSNIRMCFICGGFSLLSCRTKVILSIIIILLIELLISKKILAD